MPGKNHTLKVKNNFKKEGGIDIKFGNYTVNIGDSVSDAYSAKEVTLCVEKADLKVWPNAIELKYSPAIYTIEAQTGCTLSEPTSSGDPDCVDCVKQNIIIDAGDLSSFELKATILSGNPPASSNKEILIGESTSGNVEVGDGDK
jgi:hypothetical protein